MFENGLTDVDTSDPYQVCAKFYLYLPPCCVCDTSLDIEGCFHLDGAEWFAAAAEYIKNQGWQCMPRREANIYDVRLWCPKCWSARILDDQVLQPKDLWRAEAYKRFQEFVRLFNECKCDTPYLLWFQLRDVFHEAYEAPKNTDLIQRIYDYAWWCIDQPQEENLEDDLTTCISVAFFEHISQTEAALEDMPNWFTREDVTRMKYIFSYMVSEEGFELILKQYDKS